MTHKEFDLPAALMRNKGAVLSRDLLLSACGAATTVARAKPSMSMSAGCAKIEADPSTTADDRAALATASRAEIDGVGATVGLLAGRHAGCAGSCCSCGCARWNDGSLRASSPARRARTGALAAGWHLCASMKRCSCRRGAAHLLANPAADDVRPCADWQGVIQVVEPAACRARRRGLCANRDGAPGRFGAQLLDARHTPRTGLSRSRRSHCGCDRAQRWSARREWCRTCPTSRARLSPRSACWRIR